MRWVDHWIGLPLCFALGLAHRITRWMLGAFPAQPDLRRPVVVYKFFGLGSLMQATPLLRTLRDRQPAGRLAIVTFEANAGLLSRLHVCHDLLVIRTRSPAAFIRDVLATIVWLRRQRVGVAVDLEFFSKFSTLLSFLSGAPVRIAFHLNDYWRHMLVTHPINYNYYRHISDLYEQVAARLGLQLTDRRLSPLEPTEQSHASVERFLRDHGCSPASPLVAVNANAGDLALERRWPPERFAELVETLLTKHVDWLVVLTGSPGERDYVARLADRLPIELKNRALIAAGRLSLDEFAALLTRARIFVTNDSGPMHLAAALGVPMVSLWGPGRPEFYAPAGSAHQTIYRNYPCSPCVNMFTAFAGMWCNHEGWCMREISARQVADAVESLVALHGNARSLSE